MQKKSLVYIIGFMGSGKSTAGKKLASFLGWSFIDLDRKIEEKAGKTIAQIFSQHGESHFRSIETDLLRNVGSSVKTVVSTGGGTPCHGDNMDFMLQTGLTVYLKMTPSQLAGRLMKSTNERPLLKNITDDKLIKFIEEKLEYREKWYNMSNIIISGIDIDINLLSSRIRTSLSL
jgi:shikimate kinase